MTTDYVSSYIPDGYTAHGYIAAVPRMYGALRFTYRPMPVDERSVLFDMVERQRDRKKGESMSAKTIQKHLVDWELQYDGAEVKPTWENVLRLQPSLFVRLFNIVVGVDASDDDPELTRGEKESELDREFDAYMNVETPEDADAKNLPVG